MSQKRKAKSFKPPSTQAIEQALRILLDSVEHENDADSSALHASTEDAVLQSLRVRREALRAAHTALSKEAKNRMAILGRQRNSLVPINRLPFELVADILLRSLTPEDHKDLWRIYDLCRIQTVWWNIIKAHPPIWSTIYANDIEIVAMKLEKSSTLPIEIICEQETRAIRVMACLDFLEEHGDRIRTFTWKRHDTLTLRKFLGRPLPLLEKMAVAPKDWDEEMARSTPLEFCGGSRLRLLEFTSTMPRWGNHVILTGLQKLSMNNCGFTAATLEAFSSVLGTCVRLEEIELEDLEFNGSHNPPKQPIILPCLQSLSIKEVGHAILMPLLSLLRADALQKLIVHHGDWPEGQGQTIGIVFLRYPYPLSLITSLFSSTPADSRWVSIDIQDTTLKIDGHFSDEDREMAISFFSEDPWLGTLGQLAWFSPSTWGIPLHVKVTDETCQDDAETPVTFAYFTTMTTLKLDGGPNLALRVVESMKKPPAPAGWPCPRLRELYLDLGGRDSWDAPAARWEELVEALTSLREQRNSAEGQALCVSRLTIYEVIFPSMESQEVQDTGALYPVTETGLNVAAGLSMIDVEAEI